MPAMVEVPSTAMAIHLSAFKDSAAPLESVLSVANVPVPVPGSGEVNLFWGLPFFANQPRQDVPGRIPSTKQLCLTLDHCLSAKVFRLSDCIHYQ